VGEGVAIAPLPSLGSVSPPGVKEQRLVSWAQSQPICSSVCSGHTLGQQSRRERLVWGAAMEEGLLSRWAGGVRIPVVGGGLEVWLLPHSQLEG